MRKGVKNNNYIVKVLKLLNLLNDYTNIKKLI